VLSTLAVRFTVPVKPLAGVMVKAIPEAELPEVAELEAVQGVRAKSFCELETISTGSEPFEAA
jgi:hypothetical protein